MYIDKLRMWKGHRISLLLWCLNEYLLKELVTSSATSKPRQSMYLIEHSRMNPPRVACVRGIWSFFLICPVFGDESSNSIFPSLSSDQCARSERKTNHVHLSTSNPIVSDLWLTLFLALDVIRLLSVPHDSVSRWQKLGRERPMI